MLESDFSVWLIRNSNSFVIDVCNSQYFLPFAKNYNVFVLQMMVSVLSVSMVCSFSPAAME